MYRSLLPVTLVAALGVGSAAQALTDTGIIASVNLVGDSVNLTDGNTFEFNDEDYAGRLHSFKAGDQVTVTYHHVGTALEASAISPVTAAPVTAAPVTAAVVRAIDLTDYGMDHME